MAHTKTVNEVVTDAYLFATGKATGLAFGTSKYSRMLGLINFFVQRWAKSKDVNWASLYQFFQVVAPVSATDTFALPAGLNRISRQKGDYVRVVHTDNNESQYTIVPIEKLYSKGANTCAVKGTNLVFNTAFTADSAQFGGTIFIPGYGIPVTVVNTTDVVPIDDPEWLALRVAAEYIRNDVTRVQLYNSLLDQATDAWDDMVANNDSQDETVDQDWAPFTGENSD